MIVNFAALLLLITSTLAVDVPHHQISNEMVERDVSKSKTKSCYTEEMCHAIERDSFPWKESNIFVLNDISSRIETFQDFFFNVLKKNSFHSIDSFETFFNASIAQVTKMDYEIQNQLLPSMKKVNDHLLSLQVYADELTDKMNSVGNLDEQLTTDAEQTLTTSMIKPLESVANALTFCFQNQMNVYDLASEAVAGIMNLDMAIKRHFSQRHAMQSRSAGVLLASNKKSTEVFQGIETSDALKELQIHVKLLKNVIDVTCQLMGDCFEEKLNHVVSVLDILVKKPTLTFSNSEKEEFYDLLSALLVLVDEYNEKIQLMTNQTTDSQ